MAELAGDANMMQNIDIVECLYTGLNDITIHAYRNWSVVEHWKLVLEHLERAAKANEQEYANVSALRDKHSKDDRKKLLTFLEDEGLFDVRFYNRYSEDLGNDLLFEESHYQPRIDWLRERLLARDTTSIHEVYYEAVEKLEAIIEDERNPETTPSLIPPEHRTAMTSMVCAAKALGISPKKLKDIVDAHPGCRLHIKGQSYVFDTRIPPFEDLKGWDPPPRKRKNNCQT